MRIPYKIYKAPDVKKNEDKKEEVIHIEYEYRGLECLLSYFPRYFVTGESVTSHLTFHALTHGWEGFTSTGFRSSFFNIDSTFKATEEDIKKQFNEMLCEVNFNVDEPRQASLF